MELGLRGRKALITGASKGIGLACSAALAEEGCDVILVSRNGADLEKAAQHIRSKSNVSVTCHAADLSSSNAVTELTAAYPSSIITRAPPSPSSAGWKMKCTVPAKSGDPARCFAAPSNIVV